MYMQECLFELLMDHLQTAASNREISKGLDIGLRRSSDEANPSHQQLDMQQAGGNLQKTCHLMNATNRSLSDSLTNI